VHRPLSPSKAPIQLLTPGGSERPWSRPLLQPPRLRLRRLFRSVLQQRLRSKEMIDIVHMYLRRAFGRQLVCDRCRHARRRIRWFEGSDSGATAIFTIFGHREPTSSKYNSSSRFGNKWRMPVPPCHLQTVSVTIPILGNKL